MPWLFVEARRLDRQRAPEATEPDAARVLKRVALFERPGWIRRGAGQVRLSNALPETSAVISAVLLERADGVKVLVYGRADGTVKAEVGPAPAYDDGDF